MSERAFDPTIPIDPKGLISGATSESVSGEERGERLPERCRSLAPMRSGMYRCMLDAWDGHTEHQYNYFRRLTSVEAKRFFGTESPND